MHTHTHTYTHTTFLLEQYAYFRGRKNPLSSMINNREMEENTFVTISNKKILK